MANLDTLAQNLEVLRGRVQELIDQTDEQGAARKQATTRIQQMLQQKGNQTESLRPPPFKGMTTEDADGWIKNFFQLCRKVIQINDPYFGSRSTRKVFLFLFGIHLCHGIVGSQALYFGFRMNFVKICIETSRIYKYT